MPEVPEAMEQVSASNAENEDVAVRINFKKPPREYLVQAERVCKERKP